MGMDCPSDRGFQKATWMRKNDVGCGGGDDDEDNEGGLVNFDLKTGYRSNLPLRPQPPGRA